VPKSYRKIIAEGLDSSRSLMWREDKIWSKYSSDKVDIGETLARVIRTLSKALPLSQKLRALSIGSSNEPQFRILQTAFEGGLYLLDIDSEALGIVKERTARQGTQNVHTLLNDFGKIFLNGKKTADFLKTRLQGQKLDLITLQHSLYYCPKKDWGTLYRNLYTKLLSEKGALYSVLMSSKSKDPYTTTWLYDHFAGKFCGHTNDQDMLEFKRELKQDSLYRKTQILSKTSRVHFFTQEFGKFMAVIWMILLYPNVHRYSLDERKEITEFCYHHFFKKQKPLIQLQDHLAIYRNRDLRGIV
jgi:hypothetical protein